MIEHKIDNQIVVNFTEPAERKGVQLTPSSEHSRAKASSFSVVSLFSGCGGMDLGFRGGFSIFGRHYAKNPFHIAWANEINAAACRTYRRNIEDSIHCGDIQDYIATLPSSADVIIGGFPCQDYSVATTLKNSKPAEPRASTPLHSQFGSLSDFLQIESICVHYLVPSLDEVL